MLTSVGSLKKQESSTKASTSALLTVPKPLTVLRRQTLENLMRCRCQRTYFLRNLYVGQEVTELKVEQVTSSKLKRSMTRLYIVILLI